MTRDSVSKLKLGEESVYIRRQPSVCLCACVCVCARARGAGSSEFVQVGPSPMGAKPGDGVGV